MGPATLAHTYGRAGVDDAARIFRAMTLLLSLGSINADFVVKTRSSPSGPGSMLGNSFLRTSGGKAANVAVLAKRLGAASMLLGCVGDDDLAVQAMAGPLAEGVDLSGVARHAGPTGYSSVIVPADGAKTIVLAPNANDAWHGTSAATTAIADAPTGAVVVIDLEIPPVIVAASLKAADARRLVTVLDPAPAERLGDELLAFVDHLTPDHNEAQILTGIDTDSVEGARRAAEDLRRRGADAVHVKLASGGCVTAAADGLKLVAAPDDIDVVDATGAGDAFAGALAWAVLQGRSTSEAAEFAVAASTCAVTVYGSQESYPSLDQLQAMVLRVRTRALNP